MTRARVDTPSPVRTIAAEAGWATPDDEVTGRAMRARRDLGWWAAPAVVAFAFLAACVPPAPTTPTTTVVTPGDTEAPTWSADATLAVTGYGERTLELQWNDAVDESGIDRYEVQVEGATVSTTTDTTVVLDGLPVGEALTLAVTAFDPAGNATIEPLSVQAATLPAGAELHADVVHLTPDQLVEVVTVSDSLLRLRGDVPFIAGQVLVGAPSTAAPGGFVVRIVECSPDGPPADTTTCEITPGDIGDVVRDGDFSYSFDVAGDSVIDEAPPAQARRAAVESDEAPWTLSIPAVTVDAGAVRASVGAKARLSVDFQLGIADSQTEGFVTQFQVDLRSSATVRLMGGSVSEQVNLASRSFMPLMVAGVPMFPRLDLDWIAAGSISSAAEFSVSNDTMLSFGTEGFEAGASPTQVSGGQVDLAVNGNVSATLRTTGSLDVLLLGGPRLSADLYSGLSADLAAPDPLEAGVYSGVDWAVTVAPAKWLTWLKLPALELFPSPGSEQMSFLAGEQFSERLSFEHLVAQQPTTVLRGSSFDEPVALQMIQLSGRSEHPSSVSAATVELRLVEDTGSIDAPVVPGGLVGTTTRLTGPTGVVTFDGVSVGGDVPAGSYRLLATADDPDDPTGTRLTGLSEPFDVLEEEWGASAVVDPEAVQLGWPAFPEGEFGPDAVLSGYRVYRLAPNGPAELPEDAQAYAVVDPGAPLTSAYCSAQSSPPADDWGGCVTWTDPDPGALTQRYRYVVTACARVEAGAPFELCPDRARSSLATSGFAESAPSWVPQAMTPPTLTRQSDEPDSDFVIDHEWLLGFDLPSDAAQVRVIACELDHATDFDDCQDDNRYLHDAYATLSIGPQFDGATGLVQNNWVWGRFGPPTGTLMPQGSDWGQAIRRVLAPGPFEFSSECFTPQGPYGGAFCWAPHQAGDSLLLDAADTASISSVHATCTTRVWVSWIDSFGNESPPSAPIDTSDNFEACSSSAVPG